MIKTFLPIIEVARKENLHHIIIMLYICYVQYVYYNRFIFGLMLSLPCSPFPSSSLTKAILAAKQVELDDCKKRMVFLEEQLKVAQRQTDRATLLKLKKVREQSGAV